MSEIEYPTRINDNHVVTESIHYDGDKYSCENIERDGISAYCHTSAWPTWDYCPYCGVEI